MIAEDGTILHHLSAGCTAMAVNTNTVHWYSYISLDHPLYCQLACPGTRSLFCSSLTTQSIDWYSLDTITGPQTFRGSRQCSKLGLGLNLGRAGQLEAPVRSSDLISYWGGQYLDEIGYSNWLRASAAQRACNNDLLCLITDWIKVQQLGINPTCLVRIDQLPSAYWTMFKQILGLGMSNNKLAQWTWHAWNESSCHAWG